MKNIATILLLWLIMMPVFSQNGFTINHTTTNLNEIPDNWIDSVKSKLRIRYFRRSHGSHIDAGGMDALRRYSVEYAQKYNYNTGGTGGALKFSTQWYSLDFENDFWVQITKDFLDHPDNADINVLMWAWSAYLYMADVDQYIIDMEALIADYGPGGTKILSGERTVPVAFVFQTACSQKSTSRNETLYFKNQQIRAHCQQNNRILFDFNDIENYNPDGEYFGDGNPDGSYSGIHLLDDDCSYLLSDGSRGNWGIEWNNVNPQTELAQLSSDDICTVCEHSMGYDEGEEKDNSRLHCVLKGQAAWWLFAKLAGWNSKSLDINILEPLNKSNLDGAQLNLILSGCSFNETNLQTEDFSLNNAPEGLSIETVEYINNTNVQLLLNFDGTEFKEDVTNFSITVAFNGTNCLEEMTSNDLIINANGPLEAIWTGALNNDWNNSQNWNPENIPGAAYNVIIPAGLANYPETNSGGDFSINNLTLDSGALLNFPIGNNLQVLQNLELISTTNNYSQIIDNENINVQGQINYLKFLKGGVYHYISSPLSAVNPNIFTNTPIGYNKNFYVYNESESGLDWLTGWKHQQAIVGNMQIAGGYAYYYSKDYTFNLSGGQLNSGNIAINVNNSNLIQASDGWNLIGNPYPSAILADEFIFENQDIINGTLYFWDDDYSIGSDYSTSDYASWNLAGAIGTGTGFSSVDGIKVPDGLIAPMQSFFVKKTNAGIEQLQFNNSMRTIGNGQYFKKVKQSYRFKLSVNSITYKLYNELLIAFVDGASDDFDNLYDGIKLQGNDDISFYSLLNEQKLAIQSFSLIDLEVRKLKSIPVGIFLNKPGNYQLNILLDEGIEADVPIYLEDKALNILHEINKEGSYNFSSLAGEFNKRFVIHIYQQRKNSNENAAFGLNVKIYSSSGNINIEVGNEMIGANYSIYSLSGYKLKEDVINKTQLTAFINSSVKTVIVKLNKEGIEFSKTIILD